MTRFAVNGLFTRTYAVWRPSYTDDGMGGVEVTWAKSSEPYGRAYPAGKSEQFVADALQGEITWIFATPSDTDVQAGDEIRFDGRQLRVQVVPVTSSGRRLQVLCKEIR